MYVILHFFNLHLKQQALSIGFTIHTNTIYGRLIKFHLDGILHVYGWLLHYFLVCREPTAAEKNPDSSRSSDNLSRGAIFPGLNRLESIYVIVLLFVQVYCLFVHGSFGFLAALEFLPLLLTSVSCAVGIIWSWLLCYHELFTGYL